MPDRDPEKVVSEESPQPVGLGDDVLAEEFLPCLTSAPADAEETVVEGEF